MDLELIRGEAENQRITPSSYGTEDKMFSFMFM